MWFDHLWSLNSSHSADLRKLPEMPGLINRSASNASLLLLRMAHWPQLFLLLCLVCAAEPSLAQVVDSTQYETDSAIGSEVDAILGGMDIARRVLGGDDSEPGGWPSVVALVRPGTSRLKDRFFCGGTLVAERWVMTAAHCLFDVFGRMDTASSIRVVAGIHDLVTDADLPEVDVTNIIVHPGYDNSIETPPNDIALLELATVLDAPVGELFVGESEDYTGTIGYIVGWGATRFINENAAEYPTTQQEAPVPLVSLETCNSPISYGGIIAVTQLCAGYAEGQIDTCAGDSGGPLYIVEDGRVIQVGITSFGNGCGQENFYGIYTNVSHYIPWLGDYIPVPEQSPDLIASRQAAIDGGTTDSSSGAMSPLYLLLLVSASLIRRWGCRGASLKDRPCWRSGKTGKALLLVPFMLAMSSCTMPSIGAQENSTRIVEPPNQEKTGMPEVHDLILNADSLRSGFDGLQLGASHEDAVSNLAKAHWQKPECKTGKIALSSKGRLFQSEHCAVSAAGPVVLQGRQVDGLDLFLLDQQLVRIDVVFASAPADELTGKTGRQLSDLLDDTYQRTGVALPGIESGAVRLWRHQDDQVRFYPGGRLLFIDDRLESSLPALYESKPPFDLD